MVLDTNVLLLPYNVGSQELSKLIDIYRGLIDHKRLFIPQRVIREFVKNRDNKLGEILEKLNNSNSQLGVPSIPLPPLLQGINEATAVSDAVKQLQTAKSVYLKSLDALGGVISSWRANDPVSVAYGELFSPTIQIDHGESREKVEKDWAVRRTRQIPPGYKDKAKPDGGIGDYLIWLAILKIGRDRQQDLIFVTGEEKPDWFVRGIYPRPELIDEYRRASGGKLLRLARLGDILSELKAPTEVVEEVRQAEAEASSEQKLVERQRESEPGQLWPDIAPQWSNWIEGRWREPNSDNYPPEAPRALLQSFSFPRNRVGNIVISSADTVYVLRYAVDAEAEIYIRPTDTTTLVTIVPDVPVRGRFILPPLNSDTAGGGTLRVAMDIFVARNPSSPDTLIGRVIEIDHANGVFTLAYRLTRRRRTPIAP